ncbi:Hypothetical predicted protein [Lecanosticta acicola]|uniref:Uncharacterized protein n=1 Tax=Lecanosticta acicola TaxID=111012 RepID=A0AAI8YZC5_9PEZI|nr:Hypothetical predicted protein [Lecanosticta acicola]
MAGSKDFGKGWQGYHGVKNRDASLDFLNRYRSGSKGRVYPWGNHWTAQPSNKGGCGYRYGGCRRLSLDSCRRTAGNPNRKFERHEHCPPAGRQARW